MAAGAAGACSSALPGVAEAAVTPGTGGALPPEEQARQADTVWPLGAVRRGVRAAGADTLRAEATSPKLAASRGGRTGVQGSGGESAAVGVRASARARAATQRGPSRRPARGSQRHSRWPQRSSQASAAVV